MNGHGSVISVLLSFLWLPHIHKNQTSKETVDIKAENLVRMDRGILLSGARRYELSCFYNRLKINLKKAGRPIRLFRGRDIILSKILTYFLLILTTPELKKLHLGRN